MVFIRVYVENLGWLLSGHGYYRIGEQRPCARRDLRRFSAVITVSINVQLLRDGLSSLFLSDAY